jgi:ABC-type molybdenum transport system ATPase subunit/photorepair protein PhrA
MLLRSGRQFGDQFSFAGCVPWHKAAANILRFRAQMIRLKSISKQNGQHLLFIEASAALMKGEKVGLVGPNGAGKTPLFRMITGEERPTRDRCPSIAA